MVLVHGTYHWFRKAVGFRRDYCRRCGRETTSVLVRTFDVAHLFWIPLLPLGLWSRWYCLRCGHRPHRAPGTRRGFKIAGAFLLLLASVAFWTLHWLGVPPGEVDPATFWLGRIVCPLGLLWTLKSIYDYTVEPAFKERLAQVRSYAEHRCLLCGGMLATGTPPACSTCGARHLPLAR